MLIKNKEFQNSSYLNTNSTYTNGWEFVAETVYPCISFGYSLPYVSANEANY